MTQEQARQTQAPAEEQTSAEEQAPVQGQAPRAAEVADTAAPGGEPPAGEAADAPAPGGEAEPGSATSETGQKVRALFGLPEDDEWEEYEALHQHIQRLQINAVVGMLVIPGVALLLVAGLYAVGAERYAMALAMPSLFIGGVSLMIGNIGRSQLPRLKRLRDRWHR